MNNVIFFWFQKKILFSTFFENENQSIVQEPPFLASVWFD